MVNKSQSRRVGYRITCIKGRYYFLQNGRFRRIKATSDSEALQKARPLLMQAGRIKLGKTLDSLKRRYEQSVSDLTKKAEKRWGVEFN